MNNQENRTPNMPNYAICD